MTNAVPCDFLSISNALATVKEGDTVLIGPGSCVISKTIVAPMNTSFTLRGAGTNQTMLISGAVTRCVQVSQSGDSFVRVSDLTCVGNSANVSGFFSIDGPVRFYNLVLTNITYRGIQFKRGLVDHCVFLSGGGSFQAVDFRGDGYGSWTNTANPIGTTNAAYVEDCYFDSTAGKGNGFFDAYYGASLVFRHNVCNGPSAAGAHGYDSGDTSVRTWEIYGNVFTNLASRSSALQLRGGTGVIYSNATYGVGGAICGIGHLDYYRSCPLGHSYSGGYLPLGVPGKAYVVNFDGTAQGAGLGQTFSGNPTNGATVVLGFAKYFFISHATNATWGMQGSAGFGGAAVFIGATPAHTATNLFLAVNADPTGLGTAYAANYYIAGTPLSRTIYINHDFVAFGVTATDVILTNMLDGNTDAYGYPANQQPGVLSSYPLTSTNFVNVQTMWPVYAWSNTANGVLDPINLADNNEQCNYYITNLVKPGRDLFNDIIPSAATYTPLPYPHPLQRDELGGVPISKPMTPTGLAEVSGP